MTEREILAFLQELLESQSAEVIQGVGDDCAVIDLGERWWLLTIDALVEGVHFRQSYFSPYFLGRKLAAVNLSDVAAMGGSPRFALLTLGLPSAPEEDFLQDFFSGLTSKLAAYGGLLVGGDTVRHPSGLFLDLALIGDCAPGAAIFRHGARPKDLLFVSRPLGAAAAALEFFERGKQPPETLAKALLDPEPEIQLGQLLVQEGLATAMLDLSDGLLLDLWRLCKASKVGVRVRSSCLPLALQGELAKGLKRPPLYYALQGGEDFALLFTVPPEKERALRTRLKALSRSVYLIGEILPQEEGFLLEEEGRERAFSPEGFDHFV